MTVDKMADVGVVVLLALVPAICGYIHGNEVFGAGHLSLHLVGGGGFKVAVGDDMWLTSSSVFIHINNKTYTTSDGSLRLVKRDMDKGRDGLGTWQATRFYYQPTGLQNTMITSLYTYTDQPYIIAEQTFPEGAEGTSTGDENSVCTGFPSFSIPASNSSLGFHAFGGIMFGNTDMRSGRWGSNMSSLPVSGLDSGPLMLFDEGDNAMVISSFINVMSGSAVYTSTPHTATWGLLGKASHIPPGFTYSVILYYSHHGINQAVSGWGDTLRKYYNRHTQYRDSDFSNNYLGYYTDNGAYYYYKTEPNKTYEETLYGVQDYARAQNIPYRYIQYDSWWYYKGPKDGVTEWVSMDQVFPHGMRAVWNRTQWLSVAHNRWWSDKTPYAKQNGGKYKFIIEPEHHKALPLDQTFWDDLMRTSRQWGLMTYEQDWLNVQFDQMDVTVSDVTVGRTWLRQMGSAAAMNDVTLQYCMSPSRHALQTLEVPAVSQARVTTDYLLSPDQWRIGISSMFAHAVGVAPFKDNFWTTSVQPGNPYNKSEPHPALQCLVSTLSTGPVAPSDKIGLSNASLIMRSCDSTGRLLKPARPALAINDQIKMAASGRTLGEVWTTYTRVSRLMFGIILAADMKTNYSITPTRAGFGKELAASRVFSYNARGQAAAMFSDNSPLHLTTSCTDVDFCLYYTTPVITWQGEELLIYGEVSKWVPMSSQRFTSLTVSQQDVVMDVQGGVGEKVPLSLVYAGQWMTITCTMGQDGTARFSLLHKVCTSS